MKEIQNKWKKIGHVPKKDSDKIWKQFKSSCNHYFDRLHSKKDDANKEELEHLALKEELLTHLIDSSSMAISSWASASQYWPM